MSHETLTAKTHGDKLYWAEIFDFCYSKILIDEVSDEIYFYKSDSEIYKGVYTKFLRFTQTLRVKTVRLFTGDLHYFVSSQDGSLKKLELYIKALPKHDLVKC